MCKSKKLFFILPLRGVVLTNITHMFFKDVTGCRELKENLLQIAGRERVPHSILFTGRQGTGALALAIAFAQYLNCGNRQPEDACGECSQCRKYARLEHPDLHFVFPVARKKEGPREPVSDDYITMWRQAVLENHYLSLYMWLEAMGVENKQGFISRNESVQILKKLALKSFEARYKVMVIWMAEKMNPHAAGTLLKILEEPPPGTVFLLIAEDTDQILPTILSRTQIFRVPGLDRDLTESIMTDMGVDDPARAERLLRLSEGSHLKLQELVNEDDQATYNFSMFVQFMRLCYVPDFVGVTKWTEEMAARGRERQKHFLNDALRLIRGNFILNIEAGDMDLLTEEEKEWSAKFSQFIHQGNIFSLCDEFSRASVHIEHNGYSRLVLFDLAIKTARLLKT